jgi:hypothetical protein
MGGARNAHGGLEKFIFDKPKWKKPLGRSRCRCEDNIKTVIRQIRLQSVCWIQLAQGKCWWGSSRKHSNESSSLQNSGNFLSSWTHYSVYHYNASQLVIRWKKWNQKQVNHHVIDSRSPLLLGRCSLQMRKSSAGENIYLRAEPVLIPDYYFIFRIVCCASLRI